MIICMSRRKGCGREATQPAVLSERRRAEQQTRTEQGRGTENERKKEREKEEQKQKQKQEQKQEQKQRKRKSNWEKTRTDKFPSPDGGESWLLLGSM